MPPAEPGDWNVNGPIGKYDSTPAANPYRTDLGIETHLRPVTKPHRIQDKCSSGLRTSGCSFERVDHELSKMDSAKAFARPPSASLHQQLGSLQIDHLESTQCSI